MAAMLVEKRFPPLGTELFYHANAANFILFLLFFLLFCPPTWPPCHVVASQE